MPSTRCCGAAGRGRAMRRAAVEHAATFSWDNTVDALLASYRRAISEFTARAFGARSAVGAAGQRTANATEAWA